MEELAKEAKVTTLAALPLQRSGRGPWLGQNHQRATALSYVRAGS